MIMRTSGDIRQCGYCLQRRPVEKLLSHVKESWPESA